MTAPNTLGCEDAGQLILTVSLLFAHFCRCSGLFFRIEAFLSGAFGGVFGASLFSSLNTPVTGHWQTGIKIYLWCVLVMSACPCFVLFSVFYYSVWGFFLFRLWWGFSWLSSYLPPVSGSLTCAWLSQSRLPIYLYIRCTFLPACVSLWPGGVCALNVCVGLLVSQFFVFPWPLILGHVCIQIIILSCVFSWKPHCHSHLNRTVFANHHINHKIWYWKHSWMVVVKIKNLLLC